MVTRFVELVAWQKARVLTKEIYAATRAGSFVRDYGLRDQIQRAAVSIMANLAEGFDRGKRTEFHQFTCIAKGSCAEVRSHLYVALDAGHISEKAFGALTARLIELAKILAGLRTSLERKTIARN